MKKFIFSAALVLCALTLSVPAFADIAPLPRPSQGRGVFSRPIVPVICVIVIIAVVIIILIIILAVAANSRKRKRERERSRRRYRDY